MQTRFSWNLIPRKRRPGTRFRRTAGAAFRIGRNIAAILGLCFAYLLVLGYVQYMDAVNASGLVCISGHCS